MLNSKSSKGKALQAAANAGWKIFQGINKVIPEGKPIKPDWAPEPMVKSYQREFPELGFPRQTDSLCPKCAIEVREDVISGKISLEELVKSHYAEIKADILEEDGKIIVRKTCEKHGTFEDLLSLDAEFSRIQERRFYGRDFRASKDEHVHRHGTSTIKYGRGAVLTIDLTNRCNMMCEPCFANANQVNYVHELSLDQIKKILDNAISFEPRRVIQVQFSGGEPTISPYFLDACRYAKKVGYNGIQVATNGIRFALEPEFAFQAKQAGLSLVYLQLDGISNEANCHRHISNFFDLKKQSIENLAKAGVWITPVTTIVNGLNEEQVGHLIQFVIENTDKMDAISFQPVSFTGRDEEITDERRHRERYTTSHLAREFQRWSGGKIDPHRDWFPLGAGAPLTALADHISSPHDRFGGMCVSCHPDCGSCVFLVVNNKTKEYAPLSQFFNLEQFIQDTLIITDSARGKAATLAQLMLSFARNFDQSKAPEGLDFNELMVLIKHQFHGAITDGEIPEVSNWSLLWVGGMWFQDLWTYDFRRTEMCNVPYGTQEGEISFCAYNTGIGWRQIIESKYKNSSTSEWFKTKGRHKIYAGDKPIEFVNKPSSIKIPVINNFNNGAKNPLQNQEPTIAKKVQAQKDKILDEVNQ